jgi:hypothetical protein
MTSAHLFAALRRSLALLERESAESGASHVAQRCEAEQRGPLSATPADYLRRGCLLVQIPAGSKGPRHRGENCISDPARAAAWRKVGSAYGCSRPCAERSERITTHPFTRGSQRAINYLKRAEA